MHLGLNWFSQSLALLLTLNGLINYSYSSANLNVFDEKRFENCVNSILSKYPFISKKDLKRFRKIVHESNNGLWKNFSQLTDDINIQSLQKKLSDLLTVDDSWRDLREEAYVSAVERCFLLITGNPENDLLKEALSPYPSSNRYKRHLGSRKSGSKYKKRQPTSKRDSQPKVRQKRNAASFALASSSTSGQGSFQNSNSVGFTIRSTLLSSNFFTRVFHTGLLQADAKLIAEDITKAGLYGYNASVVTDAVQAVTNGLSFTKLNTNSENYAFLLAKSISDALKKYELISLANGNQIAIKMVREIQRLLEDKSADSPAQNPVNVQQSRQGNEASKNPALVQTNVNIQRQNFNPNPPIQPSPVVKSHPENKVAIFRNRLTSLLSESRELSDLFCKGSSPNIFQTVKSALSEYGLKISLSAATVATNTFMELNSEQSCSQYPTILSEVIRDVLFGNGLLESAKPEDIVLKIVSIRNTNSNPHPNPPPETPNQNFKSPLPLLPSFPEVTPPPYKKMEQFHDTSGIIQKSVLNPSTQVSTLHKVNEQNQVPAAKTSPIQPTAMQSESSNQPAVNVKDDAFAWVFKFDLKNILSNSNSFSSIFKPGIVPNVASNFASRMARGALSGYGPTIVSPANNQVRETIFKLPIGSETTDYSEAFALAVTDILTKNGLIKDADSKYIGNTAIRVLNEEVINDSVSGESYRTSTENPPLLSESKASTSVKVKPEPSFKSFELKRNATFGSEAQSYEATTPFVISRHTKMLSNPSTAQCEFTPTSTMAPQIITTEYISDADEFVNKFMNAFDMFTSAPNPNSKNLSDVIDDPKKLSGLLEKEMEHSLRALTHLESSEGKESNSSCKTGDNANRKQNNLGEVQVLSEPLSQAQNMSVKKENHPVGVIETSSQSESNARNSSIVFESSFTPTPMDSPKKESQREEERKSDILKKVYSISTSGIAFIRSPDFNLKELCNTLNEYAEVVGIDPVPYGNCAEVPLIDYLLHVLREVSSPMKKD